MINKQRALSQKNGKNAGRQTIPSSQTKPLRPASLVVCLCPNPLPRVLSLDDYFLRIYWGSGAVPGTGTPGVTGPSMAPAFGECHIAQVFLACDCASGDLSWNALCPWEAEAVSQTSPRQKGRGQRCVK